MTSIPSMSPQDINIAYEEFEHRFRLVCEENEEMSIKLERFGELYPGIPKDAHLRQRNYPKSAPDPTPAVTTPVNSVVEGSEKDYRRMSLSHGVQYIKFFKNIPLASLAAVPITEEVSLNDLKVLASSFLHAIKMSSGSTVIEISAWFDAHIPTSQNCSDDVKAAMDNIKNFMIQLAILLRPIVKMFRLALGFRLLVIAISSYIDLLTDIIITLEFQQSGQDLMARISAGCVSTGLFFQVFFAFIQYRKQGVRRCTKMMFLGITGILPLVEAWYVFRGKEKTDDLTMDPVFMLACTKGAEVTFEALPETAIQAIIFLGTDASDLKYIHYFGLSSSILTSALITTDAALGLGRSQMRDSPMNPVYNWLAPATSSMAKCLLGFFLSCICHFSCNVFAGSLIYQSYGFSTLLNVIGAEFFTIMLFKHFVDRELFGISVLSHPSNWDYILSPIYTFMYYAMSLVSYIPVHKNPCELGPHVTTFFMCWRFISNTAVVILTLPALVENNTLPWMTLEDGYKFYFTSLVLCFCGFYTFFHNMAKGHDTSRWWKRQTGTQYTNEIWDADEVYFQDVTNKDAEMAVWFNIIHPIYLPSERIRTWVCEELVAKYPPNSEPPKWMTKEFKDRLVTIFTWCGDEGSLMEVKLAFVTIPLHVEKKRIEDRISKEDKDTIQRSKIGQISGLITAVKSRGKSIKMCIASKLSGTAGSKIHGTIRLDGTPDIEIGKDDDRGSPVHQQEELEEQNSTEIPKHVGGYNRPRISWRFKI